MKIGDIVVFTTVDGTREGRVVKVYDDRFIKIRYWLFGVIPVLRIDRVSRMLAHKPEGGN